MIYTASIASPQFPTNPLFESKKIGNLAQVPLSRLHIIAKPTSPQVAYSGYKDNIEAFLYATYSKRKVTIGPGISYPIVEDINFLPLHSPASVATFKKPPSNETKEKMAAAWATYLPKFETTKAKKQVSVLFEGMPLIEWNRIKGVFEDGMTLDNRARPSGISWYFRILTMVNFFLQTHTYSHKSNEGDMAKEKDVATHPHPLEHRIQSGYYREGYSKDTKKLKTGEKPRRISDQEPEDLTPTYSTLSHTSDVGIEGVFVAKPSSYPTSVNFGTPSEVPFQSGLVFPYFPGLIGGDSSFVRDVVSRRFFRNLGNDCRAAYRDFRKDFGSFPNTPQGKVLTHILLGVDLALETQARLFLLFSSDTYLGFTLLGEDFSVFLNGVWHMPLAAEKVSEELSTILTHDDQLGVLARMLSEMGLADRGEKPTYTKDQFRETYTLSQALSKMSLENKDQVRAVEAIVTDLRFPRNYRTLNPKNIADSLRALVTRVPETTAEIYISHTNFSKMRAPEYSILAAYGPTTFSFVTQGGDKVLLSEDKFGDKDEQHKKIIVYNKKVYIAMDDWNRVVKERAVFQKFSERAQLSRATVFTKDQMGVVVAAW